MRSSGAHHAEREKSTRHARSFEVADRWNGRSPGDRSAAKSRDSGASPRSLRRLRLRDPALQLEPVRLQDVAIDIRIHGFVASTRLELTFHNPNPRVLEGEFVFPLAEGQSIGGYALEVDGRLREGVVVEKQTARVAYETTTRRGIDPGLAELTQGNVFRTRLYPLPPQGDKRVRIEFDHPTKNQRLIVEAPLPGDLRAVLERTSGPGTLRFLDHKNALGGSGVSSLPPPPDSRHERGSILDIPPDPDSSGES